jgi:signal transduction histidine kinase
VRVEVVTVGDAPLDEGLAALVAAAREALVNAARHSRVDRVAVYAETSEDAATVFVRDRGVGFDPAAVDGDRRGIAESITGRLRRRGGHARVTSAPGAGTEVEMTVARRAP